MVVNQPWGQNIGPLNLDVNPIVLLKGATKILPKFNGDGKVSIEDHLRAFHTTCGIISVPIQDIVVRLFV